MGHLLECEYSLILEEDKGVGEIHIHMPDLEKAFKSCTCILFNKLLTIVNIILIITSYNFKDCK